MFVQKEIKFRLVVQRCCLPIKPIVFSTFALPFGSSDLKFPIMADPEDYLEQSGVHPRRPRGSQSGREKRRDESFQVRAKEPLGTDSHRAISKNSSGCRLLIGHKRCFVLLCPIGEQFLLSSIREFLHDGYCLDHGLSGKLSL